MGQHLGELGTRRANVAITFDWFGETMRVGEHAGDLSLIDFMELAEGIDESNVVAAMRATKAFLQEQIHPEDWPRLMALAKANNQQFQDLMELSKAIIEAVSKLPSGRPSDSSNGRPHTNRRYKGGSSSAAEALSMLDGRPDLKMVVWQAEKARRELATTDA